MRKGLFGKKIISSSDYTKDGLTKNLEFKDLTSFGIAAIIGAGIFGTIGNASFSGGPAVTLLFIFTSIACLFSAMCYAEFASSVPIAGSAYTYAYVSFGEIIAWIIGWDLLMEYAIGNIAVAISWSDYFTSFLQGLGINFPLYLSMDYLTAYNSTLNKTLYNNVASEAWASAPAFYGLKIIFDLPALLITILVTWLVFIGIKESKSIGNILVLLKLFVILLVIAVGIFYVDPGNWIPFAPNGIQGILGGVSSVFFAYIGFDAISTTAEECKNPQKDLPKAMIWSLVICTVLYVLIALVLMGMVHYTELNIGDPLSYVFEKRNLNFFSGIISISAIIAMTSVLLVFQLGQPRIWMSMSRDGLLPAAFARIHPKYNTPSFSTIITGIVVAIPAMFMNLTEVTDLCSIGTLFAFAIVCGGILIKDNKNGKTGRFLVPYVNGKYIIPFLFILFIILSIIYFKNSFILKLENVPFLIFTLSFFFLSIRVFVKRHSLIPALGLIINLYLMSTLGLTNWVRFFIWLIVGLIIYFFYGYKSSNLNKNL